MAAHIVRHMSFFYRGRKVALAEGVQYDIDGNDEDLFADEGWAGASSGAVTTKVSVDTITPIQGTGIDIIRDMLNKEYVKVALALVEGKIHEIQMRPRTVSYTGENQAGSLKGKWELMGGKPEVTG